jgi:hypothetical protein
VSGKSKKSFDDFLREQRLSTAENGITPSDWSIVILNQEAWDDCVYKGLNPVKHLTQGIGKDYLVVPLRANDLRRDNLRLDEHECLQILDENNSCEYLGLCGKRLYRTVDEETIKGCLAEYEKKSE